MTISHATVVTETGKVLNVEIVMEITLVKEEKHLAMPIKPPAEAVET